MPGFVINGYGNQYPIHNNIETFRRHRWVIQQLGPITHRNVLIVANEITLPKWTPDKIEMVYSVEYKYAKNVKWSDCTISFYDALNDYSIIDELQDWRDKVHTIENGILKHSDYKQDSVLIELDGKGSEARKCTLKGSWPISIDYGKLSMSDSTIKLVELTLSLDYAIFE